MSLNLGLSTALSGLLTSQKGLNVISQNVVNVNTKGYTRKIINQESVVLAGSGAGVNEGALTRQVDNGLLRQIRTQASTLGQLDTQQNYYPQITNLFGQVDDLNSIAHNVQNLASGFSALSNQVNQAAQQSTTVNNALDVTNQLNTMTSTLQSLRVMADQQISDDVTQINTDLQTIADLNQKIVRNAAIGTATADLEDQRDLKLNDLSKYLDIQYYQRNDGSMVVYTGSGQPLLDNTTSTMTHAAGSVTSSWMSLAGGQFNKITLGNSTADLGAEIRSGELRALIDVRDSTIPDLQSQLDEMSSQLKDTINQIHNRGASAPNVTNSYTGTATFAAQGTITPATAQSAETITYSAGTASIASGAYGTLAYNYSTTSGEITVTAGTGGSLSALTAGSSFTITGSAASPPNDGTYTVMSNTGTTMTVRKSNPVQTISLGSGADTTIGLFDTNGDQIASSTLNTIMTTDYSGGGSDNQLKAQASSGPWSIDSMSKHLQSWLRAQGTAYSGATVGLDSNGHMAINLGSTVQASLVFRDQTSSTNGATAADATINFDADGDGTTDKSVQGFSNFFGLNDLFVTNTPNSIMDSSVQSTNFTTGTSVRTLRLFDGSGMIGNQINIPANSTLNQIATAINSQTQTNESTLQTSSRLTSGYTTTSAATITIGDSSSTLVTANLAAGTYTLNDLAKALTSSTVTASVVQDGSQYRLRLTDSRGVALSVSSTGGTVGTSDIGNLLGMTQTNRVRAEVVPDGAGQRLRVVQAGGQEIFAAADKDVYGNSILTDLNLASAATGTSANLSIRTDIQGNPQKISRSFMQWNADKSQYFLSEGDNTVALAMANAMTTKVSMNTAGQISTGKYTFAEHAAQTISLVSTAANNSQQAQTYQTTLNSALNVQYTSKSGVNLDEEVTNMVTYQQAYSAAAKVIGVLQEMMTTLTEMIH